MLMSKKENYSLLKLMLHDLTAMKFNLQTLENRQLQTQMEEENGL